jgi:hypothetical protein
VCSSVLIEFRHAEVAEVEALPEPVE